MTEQKQEIPEGYKQTEVGIIPKEWSVVTLEDVVLPSGLVRGPFGGALKKEYFTKSGFKVYEQRNAIYSSVEIGTYYIDEKKYQELKRFSLNPNDFIVSCSGTIGKIYQIPAFAPVGVINQALLKITLKDSIDSNYFLHIFKSDKFQEKIIDGTQGGAMKNLVGMAEFKKSTIILPTKQEQTAIANALSDVDALISELEKLIAKKQAIKTATMQQLLTGKTRLPQFALREDGTPKGYKASELGEIPEDWEVCSLGTLSERIMVGIASSATHAYRTKGISFLRNQNIKPNKLDTNDILFISEEYESGFTNKRLRTGDLLTARTGYPGTTCVVPELFDGAQSFTTLITRLKKEVIEPNFLTFYINSEKGQDFFTQNQIGGGQKNVNAATLKKLNVVIPSKKEQTAIAKIFIDIDEDIQSLQQRLNKTRQIKQGMMQELLTGKTRLVKPEVTA